MGRDSVSSVDFDKVYEEYFSLVYRAALYYAGNEHAAEEITQNVFLKLYINRKSINEKAAGAWLITTTRRMASNYRRDRWHEVPKEDVFENRDETSGIADPEEEIIIALRNGRRRDLVGEILDELYRKNRRWYEAVTLTYLLEKPQKEVAETMGVSLDVLHSMLYRAKKWIQKQYRERYEHLDDA